MQMEIFGQTKQSVGDASEKHKVVVLYLSYANRAQDHENDLQYPSIHPYLFTLQARH